MFKRRFALILVLMLLATAVRLYQIQSQSIWFDEGWSAYAAAQPTLLAAWNADLTNPPLYYVLLNIAAHLFGTSEFALRFVSLLIGLPLIPLVFQLARRTARSERAGRYAALLTTLSAPLWWASQEARMYTLLALLIVSCALAWQAIRVRQRRYVSWIALWLSEVGLLYAHNTGPVVAIWLNGVTLLLWIVYRRVRRRDWLVWIGGQVVVVLLWLPYLLQRFVLLQAANSAITSAPQLGLPLLAEVWAGLWVAPWALAIKGLPAFIIMLAIIALVVLVIARPMLRRAFWLSVHIIVLTVGLIAGLIVLGNDLHGRYLVMVVPLGLAAVGVGLASIRWRWLRSLLVLPFVLLFAFDLIVAQNPDYQHDDVRGMVQYYADHLSAADSVMAWSYADRYDLAYYWDRLGVKARRITLPEGADLDAVLATFQQIAKGSDVALNVWYTQRADYRGMMGCVLGNGTIDEPDRFTTYGMTSLIYRHPTLDFPELRHTDLTFTDSGGTPLARVLQVGQIPETSADHALCMPIQMTLQRGLGADLKAKLVVQNDLGWTVASADAIFATANQRTTSVLMFGDVVTAYPLLRLPYGAPTGEYHVYLRIYDETANPSGYNPPQAGQTLSGRDVLVGTWTALPGADWTTVKRSSDLPNPLNLAVSGDLKLIGHDLPLAGIATVINGDEIRAALLWKGIGALPDLELSDDGGTWRVTVPSRLNDHGEITLDWRSMRVPVDAPSGTATLRVGGSVILAHYRVQSLPLVTETPPFDHPIAASFPGVGELVGYSLGAEPFSHDNPPQITLVWQAGEQAPPTSYTVFAQLLNAQGQVIAQSDAIPGSRATTGWRAGEYIIDPETLSFNGNASPGTTKLIVGLYDAQTGIRLHLAEGSDAVTLTTGVEVK